MLWVNKFYFYNLCVYSPHINTILGSLSIYNFLKWFISGISVYPKHWLIKYSFSADFKTRSPHNSSIKSFVFANIVWDDVHTEKKLLMPTLIYYLFFIVTKIWKSNYIFIITVTQDLFHLFHWLTGLLGTRMVRYHKKVKQMGLLSRYSEPDHFLL